MKFNQWTVGLAAAGVVSLASAVQAEEAQHQVMTALSSTTLSGYVDTSAIWKFGTGTTVVGRAPQDGTGKQDGFNLNVVNVTLEKPLDEGQWSAGYKAELLFGPDGATYDGYGQHIKQAYVTLRAPVGNGLDFKIGVFDTIIGYETFNSYANPNYSRSYGWTLEPTQHTGVLASYRCTDWLSASVGVANTWNAVGNGRATRGGLGAADESEKTYMASVTLTAPESWGSMKGSALYLGAINGLAGGQSDTTSLYAGVTVPTPLTGLSLGASYDYVSTVQKGNRSGGKALFGGNDGTYANAAAVYASYQATEKLKINTRVEYASGTDGTFGYFRGEQLDSESRNEVFGATITADYSLWANVITRLEARWDSVLTGGATPSSKPFGLATNGDKNAISLALNVIYKF